MSDDDVNIRIKEDTWKRLNHRKEPNDSFDDVLQRVLDEVDEGNSARMTPTTAD